MIEGIFLREAVWEHREKALKTLFDLDRVLPLATMTGKIQRGHRTKPPPWGAKRRFGLCPLFYIA
jgi:hypothetical protein